jgi:signal transduction histidine kinase
MSEATAAHLPACFAAFPGAVLHLSADGIVLESNGWLDRELGRGLVGQPFSAALDAESCGEKWSHILRDAKERGGQPVSELVFATGNVVLEPRSFSVLWDKEAGVVWLIEHPADARMEGVRQQVVEVNSELANTQRDLVRERGRLARSLADTERSNRALDEFAHAISHDLKAPLRSVANYARWIEEDLGDRLTGEPRAHMDLLRSQVERMRTMINGVLQYARSGRTRATPEAVDVGALVSEVVALLDPPRTCTIDVAPDMPIFVTERAPLFQVLLNLIGNATKHARRADPHVWVSARDTGAAYDFAVRDNGPGIPARAQEKIWALFHTLQPRSVKNEDGEEGTGMGLAIVRQLVEMQGGQAWVESEEGKGATFHFLWPKRQTSQGSAPTAPAGTASNA